MTLEQSEYQRLVELIIELFGRYHEPAAHDAIISELKKIYKKVSIYPGIITMCLPRVIQPAELDKLKEGEEVIFSLKDGQVISGKVVGVDSKEIKLAECKQLASYSSVEKSSVQKETVEKARLITRDILKKEWPTLDFKEE